MDSKIRFLLDELSRECIKAKRLEDRTKEQGNTGMERYFKGRYDAFKDAKSTVMDIFKEFDYVYDKEPLFICAVFDKGKNDFYEAEDEDTAVMEAKKRAHNRDNAALKRVAIIGWNHEELKEIYNASK